MKCFACDKPTSKYDGPSGRYYCEECTFIWQEAANMRPKTYENEDGELPMLDEDFDTDVFYEDEPEAEDDEYGD